MGNSDGRYFGECLRSDRLCFCFVVLLSFVAPCAAMCCGASVYIDDSGPEADFYTLCNLGRLEYDTAASDVCRCQLEYVDCAV